MDTTNVKTCIHQQRRADNQKLTMMIDVPIPISFWEDDGWYVSSVGSGCSSSRQECMERQHSAVTKAAAMAKVADDKITQEVDPH